MEVLPTATGCAVSKRQWVVDEAVRACARCQKGFSVVRRRHHCRHCGEVVCDACSKSREPLEHDGAVTVMRVCVRCARQFVADRGHPLYRLLGAVLGPQYFYAIAGACGGDVDSLLRMPADGGLDAVLDRAQIAGSARAEVQGIIKKAQCTGAYDLSQPPGLVQRSRDIPM